MAEWNSAIRESCVPWPIDQEEAIYASRAAAVFICYLLNVKS